MAEIGSIRSSGSQLPSNHTVEIITVQNESDSETESGSNLTDISGYTSLHRPCGPCAVLGPQKERWVQVVMCLLFVSLGASYGVLSSLYLAKWFPWLTVLPLCFIVAVAVTYGLCALTEPGIVPSEAFTPDRINPSVRFCIKCNIYQTDDTFHCNHCEACVKGLDHHCGVVGMDIGSRNKVHFIFFCYYCSAMMIWLIIGSVFMAVVRILYAAEYDSGQQPPHGLFVAATVNGTFSGLAFLVSSVLYFLIYFNHLPEKFTNALVRFLCFRVLYRPNDFLSNLDRRPLCCGNSSFGKLFSAPASRWQLSNWVCFPREEKASFN